MKQQNDRVRRASRWLIRALFLAVVLFFVGRYVYKNWATIQGKTWHVEWTYVALALLTALLSFFIMVEMWRRSLAVCGAKVTYGLAWNTWFRTLLAKYVPGKVWAVLGLVYFAKQKGVPVEKSAAAAALWQGMAFPGLSIIFLITIPLWRILPPQYTIVIAVSMIVLMAIVLHPALFYPILNLTLRKLGKAQVEIRFRYTSLIILILLSAGISLIQGLGFTFFARSLTTLNIQQVPLLVGGFCLSLMLGLVSFFAPAGIGVREGILLAFLANDFSPDLAIMIGIGARIWWTFAEMSFTGLSLFATKSVKNYNLQGDAEGRTNERAQQYRDFTHGAYIRYLEVIKSSYPRILRLDEYMTMQQKPDAFIIVRHDVDRRPNMALRMARLEHEMGVKTTYYFRTKGRSFDPRTVKEVAALGHEVGYHYESLSDAHGNVELALRYFKEGLEKLSRFVSVKTISAHGRPWKSYNNADLWLLTGNHDLLKELDLLGCVNHDIDYRGVVYIHDTGRNWYSSKANIRDCAPNSIVFDFKDGEDLYRFFASSSHKRVVFHVHPERWANNSIDFCYSYAFDLVANFGKKVVTTLDRNRFFERMRQ